MVSSCFGGINLAFIFLPYLITFDKITENIIESFFIDPFSVFIIFGELFFNFIVCIFGTVAGYV